MVLGAGAAFWWVAFLKVIPTREQVFPAKLWTEPGSVVIRHPLQPSKVFMLWLVSVFSQCCWKLIRDKLSVYTHNRLQNDIQEIITAVCYWLKHIVFVCYYDFDEGQITVYAKSAQTGLF